MTYFPGDHYMICDVCGFKHRRHEMRKRWDGLWVCPADFEPRHPQDIPRPLPVDKTAPSVVRNGGSDLFLTASITSSANIDNPSTTTDDGI